MRKFSDGETGPALMVSAVERQSEVIMPRCPSCFALMTYVKEGPIVVRKTCPSCFGVWIERIRLLRMARTQPGAVMPTSSANSAASADPSQTADLRDLVEVVVESDTKKPLDCPDCHATMEIQRLHPMIPVNLQNCRSCASDWLDVGKLELISRLYWELLHSSDPKIVELREKYALASLGLEELKERDAASIGSLGRAGQMLDWTMGLSPGGGVFSLEGIVGALSKR